MARVLIVDDEIDIRQVISRILQSAGHATSTAENGRQAMDHLQREPVDLMITDVFMPEMEGLETVKLTRRLYPALPIIAVSGGGSLGASEYLMFARCFGATATLEKPFEIAGLLDLVNELLNSPGDASNTAE